MADKTPVPVPGTDIELYDISGWSRSTIADGKWLNDNTIRPLEDNEYILASAIQGVSEEVDLIKAQSDVADVVGTYQDLVDYEYPLTDRDIVKVLHDENCDSGQSYWRVSGGDPGHYEWEFIGDINDQSDWNQQNPSNPQFIKNKPGEIQIVAGPNVSIYENLDGALEVSAKQQNLNAGDNLNIRNDIIDVKNDSCTSNSTTSVALGSHTVANGTGQVVVGKYNETSNSDLFQVGGGTDDNERKNLLNVNGDGKFYINTESHITISSSLIYDGFSYGSDIIAPARKGFTRLAAWRDRGSVSNAHSFDVRVDSADNTFSNIISSEHFKLVWISGNVAVKYLAGNGSLTQITNGIILDHGGGSYQEISQSFPQIPIPDNTWMYNSVSAPFFLPNPYTYSTAPLMLHFGKSAAIVGTETDISYSYSFIMWGLL